MYSNNNIQRITKSFASIWSMMWLLLGEGLQVVALHALSQNIILKYVYLKKKLTFFLIFFHYKLYSFINIIGCIIYDIIGYNRTKFGIFKYYDSYILYGRITKNIII